MHDQWLVAAWWCVCVVVLASLLWRCSIVSVSLLYSCTRADGGRDGRNMLRAYAGLPAGLPCSHARTRHHHTCSRRWERRFPGGMHGPAGPYGDGHSDDARWPRGKTHAQCAPQWNVKGIFVEWYRSSSRRAN